MRSQNYRKSNTEESDINLTPMLDVVFIMLIFFIVTATFIKEPGIDVLRPEAKTHTIRPLVSVLVAINNAGEIWIDNTKVSPEAVRVSIEKIHNENPKGGMVIQADQNSSAERLTQVLEAARLAGITNVAISTKR